MARLRPQRKGEGEQGTQGAWERSGSSRRRGSKTRICARIPGPKFCPHHLLLRRWNTSLLQRAWVGVSGGRASLSDTGVVVAPGGSRMCEETPLALFSGQCSGAPAPCGLVAPALTLAGQSPLCGPLCVALPPLTPPGYTSPASCSHTLEGCLPLSRSRSSPGNFFSIRRTKMCLQQGLNTSFTLGPPL